MRAEVLKNKRNKRNIMSNASRFNVIRSINSSTAAPKILLGLMLAVVTASLVHAQGQIPSGTISGSGSGPYTYNLTFSDDANASSPIGSVWYAWVPGAFYLPGVPTSAAAPAGWTASVSLNSIQFTADSAANYITPGGSLPGFSYQATYSPATLAATPNSGDSFAYSAGLFSDAGNIFTVQLVAAPEPSTLMLFISGATGLCIVGRRKPWAKRRSVSASKD
jgi:hypothetical protein